MVSWVWIDRPNVQLLSAPQYASQSGIVVLVQWAAAVMKSPQSPQKSNQTVCRRCMAASGGIIYCVVYYAKTHFPFVTRAQRVWVESSFRSAAKGRHQDAGSGPRISVPYGSMHPGQPVHNSNQNDNFYVLFHFGRKGKMMTFLLCRQGIHYFVWEVFVMGHDLWHKFYVQDVHGAGWRVLILEVGFCVNGR